MRIKKTLLNNERGIALAVLTMLIAILTSMTGAALVFSRVDLMISNNFKKGTQALYAADAGIGEALNQLTGNVASSISSFSRDLGGGFSYRSGRRTDSGPQPLEFAGSQTATGYSMGSGTGYNPSGYIMLNFNIHVTGEGPLTSAREIEAQGAYGPVPN